LAQEAEAFCQDLERFFRRAFGDLPKAADLSELRAEQATVRDLLRRATEAGGESGAKLTAMTAERDKLKAGLLQSKADFLNFQARAGKDLTRAEELALRRYMQDMLPILDSLKLALRDAASPEIDTKRLKDALLLIDTSLNQALSVRGLQRIAVEAGTPYDANLHEAVAMRPADAAKGEKPNTVLEELRPGYLWKGLVLRPPQVLISEPEKQAKKQ
jgi:molecular chaperone GrpE